MKKYKISFFLMLSFFLFGNSLSQENTSVKEIVDKYLESIGGIKAVKAINSKQITYKVHMFARKPYLMERYWDRSGKMRTGPPGAETYTLTEGDHSWRISPGKRHELPSGLSASLSKLADIDGPLIDSDKKGVSLVYSGKVHYDMTELHQITVTFPDGTQWQYFFDTRTGLLRKMIQPSFYMVNNEIKKGADVHFYYYDYRPAGSVLFPYCSIQISENHTHLFVVQDIQLHQ